MPCSVFFQFFSLFPQSTSGQMEVQSILKSAQPFSFSIFSLENFRKIIYQFFPSYHGNSACDALAAIVKKKIEKKNKEICKNQNLKEYLLKPQIQNNELQELQIQNHDLREPQHQKNNEVQETPMFCQLQAINHKC